MYRLCGYDFTSIYYHLFYFFQWQILSKKEGRRKKGGRERQIERAGGREGDEKKKGGKKEMRETHIERLVNLLEFSKEQKVCARHDPSCL